MPNTPDDDNTQDFTVYDLAERAAGGLALTVEATYEIRAEWTRVHSEMCRITNGDGQDIRTRQGQAQYVLWVRDQLTKLLASMQ